MRKLQPKDEGRVVLVSDVNWEKLEDLLPKNSIFSEDVLRTYLKKCLIKPNKLKKGIQRKCPQTKELYTYFESRMGSRLTITLRSNVKLYCLISDEVQQQKETTITAVVEVPEEPKVVPWWTSIASDDPEAINLEGLTQYPGFLSRESWLNETLEFTLEVIFAFDEKKAISLNAMDKSSKGLFIGSMKSFLKALGIDYDDLFQSKRGAGTSWIGSEDQRSLLIQYLDIIQDKAKKLYPVIKSKEVIPPTKPTEEKVVKPITWLDYAGAYLIISGIILNKSGQVSKRLIRSLWKEYLSEMPSMEKALECLKDEISMMDGIISYNSPKDLSVFHRQFSREFNFKFPGSQTEELLKALMSRIRKGDEIRDIIKIDSVFISNLPEVFGTQAVLKDPERGNLFQFSEWPSPSDENLEEYLRITESTQKWISGKPEFLEDLTSRYREDLQKKLEAKRIALRDLQREIQDLEDKLNLV